MATDTARPESITCPKCGQVNQSWRSQCENCKAPLAKAPRHYFEKVPDEFKTLTNIFSVLSPILLSIPGFFRILFTHPDAIFLWMIVLVFVVLYYSLLYVIAGGRDWSGEKYSTGRVLIFLILSGVAGGILFYGIWYVVRVIMAKIYKIPMKDARGRLFTWKEEQPHPKEEAYQYTR